MEKAKRLTLHNWADEDKPREKLILKGKSALSDAELISILFGTGTKEKTVVELAKELLFLAKNDLSVLASMSINELTKVKGIGEAKAISLISALELGRRRKEVLFEKKPIINSSSKVYEVMNSHLYDLPYEELWLICLSNQKSLIQKSCISKGGLNATIADVRIIFKNALECNSSAIILVHNHPSGTLNPSNEDKNLTEKVKNAGKVMQINLDDHLIFTNSGYYSFADEGIL